MTNLDPCPGITLESAGGPPLHEQVEILRHAGPAVPVRLPEDVVAWSVTRGDVIKRLLSHPAVSRDAKQSKPGYQPGAVAWLVPWVDAESMFNAEGRDHTRLRRLVGPVFAPRRIEAMRPRVEAVVHDLLDALAAYDGDEPVDLRAAFAYALPTRVICDLFGVPGPQRPAMLELFNAVLSTGVAAEEAAAVSSALEVAIRELIETKRRHPGEDMTSLLLATHEESGDRLSEQELIDMLILMLGAGSGTAIALIGHAVTELLLHRGQLDIVLNDASTWADVIEETLRLHPSVMHMPMRWATEDIDLGEGVVIRAGDPMIIGFGAHGRDPSVHDDPETFDISRKEKSHLAFGHGIHYCLGAPLARLEASVALPALFARFPELTLATPPRELEHLHSFIGNDITTLPVLLGRSARAA
ncbi:cytochrome P450 family protein [Streptomyces sp. NBC_00690]|uniref:cytochrome P450 family protein n=1 Tax=Streptomyces sp. NBC_00690 TaxID=2975808 RepID=UPI002E298FD0|nr:cytochrome P450 [Streptomyces sp. NBC_00690]